MVVSREVVESFPGSRGSSSREKSRCFGFTRGGVGGGFETGLGRRGGKVVWESGNRGRSG